jgi:hypothetical protein
MVFKAITFRYASALVACFRNHRSFDHIASDYHVLDGRGLVLDAAKH